MTLDEQLEYWKQRAQSVEKRNDALVWEIIRLKGGRALTSEEIAAHNKRVAEDRDIDIDDGC